MRSATRSDRDSQLPHTVKKQATTDPDALITARYAYRDDVPDNATLVSEVDGVRVMQVQSGVYYIAHRGTATLRDLHTDFLLGIGVKKDEFKQREQYTLDAIRSIREKDPNAVIRLTGHSLGGTTVNYAMQNPAIGDEVDKAYAYNMGTSPFFKETLAPNVDSIILEGDPISENQDPTKRRANTVTRLARSTHVIDRKLASVIGLLNHFSGRF